MRLSIKSVLTTLSAGILLTSSVMAAAPPAYWQIEDLPKAPPSWFAVQVAKFPSSLLAEGVQKGLQESGWGPVQLETAPDGETVVLLGQLSGSAQAWTLYHELKSQKVAKGAIVPMAVTANKSQGFSGPTKKAFEVVFPSDPQAQKQLQDELSDELEMMAGELDGDQEKLIREMLVKLQAGKLRDPALARGAVTAAQVFWDRKVASEPALYLASRVASGNWPVAATDQDKLFQAKNLTYDLLYGTRRDWLGAWKIATEMERQAGESGEVKSQNLLRQAALMVDLVQQQSDPKPSFEVVREKLLAARHAAPETSTLLLAQIDYLYLQTFAWQGNWNRVEEMATALSEKYQESAPVYAGLSRVWLAKSLERHERYRKAVEILQAELSNRYAQSLWPRRGYKTLNPYKFTSDTFTYFQDLAMSQGIELKLDPTLLGPAEPQEVVPEVTPLTEEQDVVIPEGFELDEPESSEVTSEEEAAPQEDLQTDEVED